MEHEHEGGSVSHKNLAVVCAIAVSNCDGVSITEGLALDSDHVAVQFSLSISRSTSRNLRNGLEK